MVATRCSKSRHAGPLKVPTARCLPGGMPRMMTFEIEEVFAALPQQGVEGLLVDADAFFVSRRDQLVALVARHSIPAIYDLREFAAAGGLMSYGTSLTDGYRLVGSYTGRILKGARPAELPGPAGGESRVRN